MASRAESPIKCPRNIPTAHQLYESGILKAAQRIWDSNPSDRINKKVGLIRYDITRLGLSAIVNAANKTLLGGGGVDGAIHRAAGPGLLEDCQALGGCETGHAKITLGHQLPARHVIHAVGPIYNMFIEQETRRDQLRSCYLESLKLAVENKIRTIAFPCISTGVYCYPHMSAAKVACEAVRDFLETEDGDKLDMVVFVTFEEEDVTVYNIAVPMFFPPEEVTRPRSTTDDGNDE